MAKQTSQNPQRSKIRILFVDADLAQGELDNFTQALTSAIRSTSTISRPVPQLSAPQVPTVNGAEITTDETDASESIELDDSDAQAPAMKSVPRKRSYRKPIPVEIDMKAGGKSFEDYAKEKSPSDTLARYLVAAAWLHEYAKITAVTANHIYTCYKSAGWIFDVKDSGWPLRKLKADGLGTTKEGAFSINHLGLAEVEKMTASGT